jgi:hypothetical protein
MGYSPGPWKVLVKGENFFGVNSNDGNVCILAAEDKKKIDKKANARLVAAAPELLEALREAHAKLLLLNALQSADECAKAIAKATGET